MSSERYKGGRRSAEGRGGKHGHAGRPSERVQRLNADSELESSVQNMYARAESSTTEASTRPASYTRDAARCHVLGLPWQPPSLSSIKAPLARFLGNVGEKADALRIISLRGLTNLSDDAAQKLFTIATRLEEVDLSGCARISAKTLEVLVSHNPRLHTLNISYTDAGPAGLEEALLARRLRVLKAADVLGLTGKAVTTAVNRAMARAAEVEHPFVPLLELRKLKVKNTIIDEVGLGALIKLCGARLESLDISYTALRTLMSLETGPVSSGSPSKLQKLVLNGLNLSKGTSLSQLIEWSAPTLLNLQCSDIDDEHCWRWITRLEGRDTCPLRKLVIGDTCFQRSLTSESQEICRTFPSLKALVLKGNVLYLDSEDLPLQRLEGSALFRSDTTLGLGREEVADLVLRSPFLESINLTGCRSIPVQQRRSYFEHFDVAYANEIAALREQHPHQAAMFR
ncbi:F-BOX/LEUCINE RICH REPEAT PROTEIN [Ceraceosorus bombacis]|uniref:F-BOX/LEUCINE RICH REPEAT PROTEIN n=1 Tax=Ceraceosorus bombacis TaxID=401625 RepID=A0A0P1BDI1_9BASI|nr:F-BOX/LEUCINE RICH REPEAT PROTEIN [Ceraceosorus bombacis]